MRIRGKESPASGGPLISSAELQSARRILFVIRLALGDFVYMQQFFIQLKAKYKDLKIDIWIATNEKIFTSKKSSRAFLIEWVKSCGLFDDVYVEIQSIPSLYFSLKKVREKKYSIIFFFLYRFHRLYTMLLLIMNLKSSNVGVLNLPTRVVFLRKFLLDLSFKKKCIINRRAFHKSGQQILEQYSYVFNTLFGITKKNNIPLLFNQGIKEPPNIDSLKNVSPNNCFRLFLNARAMAERRCWDVGRLKELINLVRKGFPAVNGRRVSIVVNTPQDCLGDYQEAFSHDLNIEIFNPHDFHTFIDQIAISDFVISVDTSIAHFAAALDVPLVMMIRGNVSEWRVPDESRSIVITTARPRWHISRISPERVYNVFCTAIAKWFSNDDINNHFN